MSDWGGPYVAAMLPVAAGDTHPVTGVSDDAGTLHAITGIGTRGSVPALGAELACRVLLILWAGRQRGTDVLTLSVTDPAGAISPPVSSPISYPDEPDSPIVCVVPVRITVNRTGVYWVRAGMGSRLLARCPIRIDLAPGIPAAFLRS